MLLEDRFGRRFGYVRVSLTEACNFRCGYCLPDGYRPTDQPVFLSKDEVVRLVRALSLLGVEKIRLTGGEPSLRSDLVAIAAEIKQIPSIKTLCLTTNGYRLEGHAKDYAKAGIEQINLSIDSLKPDRFFTLTGTPKLEAVMSGLEAALDAGITVKINAVLHKGVNEDELEDFITLSRRLNIAVRFIELMQTGDNKPYFDKYHLSNRVMRERLETMGFLPLKREQWAGPAVDYTDLNGARIGLISPYGQGFCDSCNRLRISARGRLKLCLFGDDGVDLRPHLAKDGQEEALCDALLCALRLKKDSHQLAAFDTGTTRHLAQIGG